MTLIRFPNLPMFYHAVYYILLELLTISIKIEMWDADIDRF